MCCQMSKYLIPKLQGEDRSSKDVCWATLVNNYLQELDADHKGFNPDKNTSKSSFLHREEFVRH